MNSDESYEIEIVDISEFFQSDTGSDSEKESEEFDQKSTFGEVDSPIKELKAIILSLDWEITNEIADSFVDEVDRLSTIWADDKNVLGFLQILRAVAKYLRTYKSAAHPDSIKLLYSVYNNFEKIVLTDEISAKQETEILNEELHKFKILKSKIATAASTTSKGKANESLLSTLKSIVLEIDWSITDQTMQKFDLEITKFEKIWKSDKTFLTPLQMMRAIGNYINKNKLHSHPESIKLLNTVFTNFEKMALSEDLPLAERHRLIQEDLAKFSILKKQIIINKSTPQKPKKVPDQLPPTPEKAMAPPGQLFNEETETVDVDSGYVVPLNQESTAEPIFPGNISEPPPSGEDPCQEVDDRLNHFFGDMEDVRPIAADGLTPLPADIESEVTPLPMDDVPLAADSQQTGPPAGDITPLPADIEFEVAPLPMDDVIPLAADSQQTDHPAGDITPLPADIEFEVTPMPMDDVIPLAADGQQAGPPAGDITPLPADIEFEVTPMPMDDVIPLAADSQQTDHPAGDITPLPTDIESEITPLPLAEGKDVSLAANEEDIFDLAADDKEIIPPLPADYDQDQAATSPMDALCNLKSSESESESPILSEMRTEVFGPIETDKGNLDGHIDNFFESESDTKKQPDDEVRATPVPLSPPAFDSLTAAINSLSHQQNSLIDISPLTAELEKIQYNFPHPPLLSIILKMTHSVAISIERLGNDAPPESFDFLQALGKSINEPESNDISMSLQTMQELSEQFIHYQNNIILPTLADLLTREKEIKKIFGILT